MTPGVTALGHHLRLAPPRLTLASMDTRRRHNMAGVTVAEPREGRG